MVKCKVCGIETNMEGTKLCDRCWELKRQLESLEDRNKKACEKFIKDEYKKMKKG